VLGQFRPAHEFGAGVVVSDEVPSADGELVRMWGRNLGTAIWRPVHGMTASGSRARTWAITECIWDSSTDVDFGLHGEVRVLGHLFSLVPDDAVPEETG
jgi:hypothetical protein